MLKTVQETALVVSCTCIYAVEFLLDDNRRNVKVSISGINRKKMEPFRFFRLQFHGLTDESYNELQI